MIESSPFIHRNIRHFIALRVFYNSRFYYPVLTVLFLDYGLTIEQFTLLNVVWALTIVVLEVPSGALADLFGRKRLLVWTALLMIAEMAIIAFAPLSKPEWIFPIFLINRILSGISEAMASGADEALAYDTLVESGQRDQWSKVLEIQIKFQQIGFIIAMTVGALVYDPQLMSKLLQFFGSTLELSQQQTMRFPLLLTLGSAIVTLIIVLRMEETERNTPQTGSGFFATACNTSYLIIESARWVWQTPFAVAIILYAMLFDHIIRMFLTLNSQYYRLLDIPEAVFGLIGSAMALIGVFIPRFAKWLTIRYNAATNVVFMSLAMLVGCYGFSLFIPYYGVLPMALIFAVFMLNMYFASHYLNQITPSHMRATVLSFRGLSFNLAYAFIGMGYTIVYSAYKKNLAINISPEVSERLTFIAIGQQFTLYFIITLLLVTLISFGARHVAKNRTD